MRKVSRILAPVLSAVVLAALCADLARKAPTQAFDDSLWFMRSQVSPCDVSAYRYRYWSIDLPALNRWVYYLLLKTTGLDRVPDGEAPCWSLGPAYVNFKGSPTAVGWKTADFPGLAEWEQRHGQYAPRTAIVAMRMANVAAFAVCVFSLWLTARMILRSGWLAGFAVLPILLSPVFATTVSFQILSGDVFLVAALAAMLAAWTFFHLRGMGVSTRSIVVVSLLAGAATGAKHHGILAVAAFAVYLVWQSRGWARLINPFAAALLSFAVFVAINPVIILFPGEWPWNVCLMMAQRRAETNAMHVSRLGPLGLTECFNFFWWPLLPATAYLFWASRREKWVAPLVLWAGFLIVGMVTGMMLIKVAAPRYLAPLELAVFFPVGLAVMALCRKHCGGGGGNACPSEMSPEPDP